MLKVLLASRVLYAKKQTRAVSNPRLAIYTLKQQEFHGKPLTKGYPPDPEQDVIDLAVKSSDLIRSIKVYRLNAIFFDQSTVF